MKDFLNMDCMEGMKEFEDNFFDLAIVDPPYFKGPAKEGYYGGAKWKKGTGLIKKYRTIKDWDNNIPDKNYLNELIRVSKHQIIWGINYYQFYHGPGRVIWDKKNDGSTFSKCEIASCSLINSVQIFRYMWNGMLQENMKNKEDKIHPTQKPVQLYKWLLRNYAQPHFKILSTHVGSASDLIAFEDFGCEYVGYEIDKDYYEAAKKRLEQHKAQMKLF